MSDSIITDFPPLGQCPRRPSRTGSLPRDCDPVRRFVAAYACQAVVDYLYRPPELTADEYETAAEFCHSPIGREIIYCLDIAPSKVNQTLGEAA